MKDVTNVVMEACKEKIERDRKRGIKNRPVRAMVVGIPNVGKSTIFSALTKAPAEAANYPFCTIDPNIGIVDLPDERLDFMASVFQPKKKIPATVDFVDIAGLIKGASSGEGLGNKFQKQRDMQFTGAVNQTVDFRRLLKLHPVKH